MFYRRLSSIVISNVMDQLEEAKLKRIRANKKSCFTRICYRVESLIATQGSRTLLQQLLGDIDRALDAITEANESYLTVLSGEAEKTKAAEYMSEIEIQRDNTVQKITAYLQTRSCEAPSVASTVPSHRSAASVSRSHEAMIEARLTALKLRQTERRLQREKDLKILDLKIQAAGEEAEVAELEAKLRHQAVESGSVDMDRAGDFVDEDLAAHREEEPERYHIAGDDRSAAAGGGVVASHAHDSCIPGQKTGRWRTADWIGRLNAAVGMPAMRTETARHHSELRGVPRISLPKFAGDPLEWPKWIGLFKALIHEQPGMSDAEKIVHLQSAVTGLAQQTIEGMLYDGQLYPKALQALQSRFGRSEDIVFANLSAVFQSQPLKHMDTAALEKFQARLHCAITTLELLGYTSDVTSFENLRRAVAKLPVQLRHEWGKRVVELEPRQATLSDLDDWLALQVRISLSSAVPENPGDKTANTTASRRRPPAAQPSMRSALTMAAPQRSPQSQCSLCNSQHSLSQCSVFAQKSAADRAQHVADSGRCFRCLEVGHISRRCPSTSAQRCSADGCNGRHHRLLHGSQRVFPRRETGQSESAGNRLVGAALSVASTTTLLQVVPVRVYGPDGSHSDTHALLDAGAQTSLCTDQLRHRLGIVGKRQELQLNNVEGTGEKRAVQKFALQVSPRSTGDAAADVTVQEVFSVPQLNVRPQTVDWSRRQEWLHLADLDIPDTSNKQIDLLLGANVTEAVVQREARVGRQGQPIAVRTAFGWCLSGNVTQLVSPGARHVMHMTRVETPEEELNSLVKEWWSTESFGTKFDSKVALSAEDRRAEQLLADTTQWRGDRYETGLLWRSDDISLPDNYMAALHRLESTEKRLLRQPATAAAYQRTFQEYVDKGYARKLTAEDLEVKEQKRWFLPHHAVTNANKPGKIRVVFDAAASHRGISLNSQLLTGPDLLQSIPGVLLRFREQCVGISADIEQMYHQWSFSKSFLHQVCSLYFVDYKISTTNSMRFIQI